MALSEREQQMLDEMEQALYAEDPRFASSMKGGSATTEQKRRRIIGGVGAAAGLAIVILGVSTSIWVGVAGFAVIVASLAVALAPARETTSLHVVADDGTLASPKKAERGPRIPGKGTTKGRPRQRAGRSPSSGSFMQRLEERWGRRRQQGH